MEKICLRPHHGLCIRFFEGKGYSREFTEHMGRTIERLQKDGCVVLITDKEDEICRECPNLSKEGCISGEKVKRYDRIVMEMTKVSCGRELHFQELQKLVEEQIIWPGKIHEVCEDCAWALICHKK